VLLYTFLASITTKTLKIALENTVYPTPTKVVKEEGLLDNLRHEMVQNVQQLLNVCIRI